MPLLIASSMARAVRGPRRSQRRQTLSWPYRGSGQRQSTHPGLLERQARNIGNIRRGHLQQYDAGRVSIAANAATRAIMSSRSFRLVRLTDAAVMSTTVSRSGRSSLIYLCLSLGNSNGRICAAPQPGMAPMLSAESAELVRRLLNRLVDVLGAHVEFFRRVFSAFRSAFSMASPMVLWPTMTRAACPASMMSPNSFTSARDMPFHR